VLIAYVADKEDEDEDSGEHDGEKEKEKEKVSTSFEQPSIGTRGRIVPRVPDSHVQTHLGIVACDLLPLLLFLLDGPARSLL